MARTVSVSPFCYRVGAVTNVQDQTPPDYKPATRLAAVRLRARRRYWLSLALVLAAGGSFELLSGSPANAVFSPAVPPPATAVPAVPADTTANLRVANGDTLAALFASRNLSATDLQAIMDLDNDATARLKRIVPGDLIHVRYTPDGHVQELRMLYDSAHTLDIARDATGFSGTVTEIPAETSTAYAHGIIEGSLFDSAVRAGLTDTTTMELIQLFGWDIDFAHDIQNGDSFTVLYARVQRRGQAIANGPILAAEFTSAGKSYEVLRYTDPKGDTGYYTPDGHSVRKALMRAPVSYSHISSSFSLHRKHPILGFTRAHQGVDYAAPSGTPIMAAGDGRVTFVGSKGGYGKCLIIDHGGGYSTLYGHLSHFRRGLHSGMHVKQQQVVGYVGMTGLATGPHLHFEVRLNGVARNPRTVQLPSAAPVQAQFLADFQTSTKNILAQLGSTDSRLATSTANSGAVQTAAH